MPWGIDACKIWVSQENDPYWQTICYFVVLANIQYQWTLFWRYSKFYFLKKINVHSLIFEFNPINLMSFQPITLLNLATQMRTVFAHARLSSTNENAETFVPPLHALKIWSLIRRTSCSKLWQADTKIYRIKHKPKKVILWLDIQVINKTRQNKKCNISILFQCHSKPLFPDELFSLIISHKPLKLFIKNARNWFYRKLEGFWIHILQLFCKHIQIMQLSWTKWDKHLAQLHVSFNSRYIPRAAATKYIWLPRYNGRIKQVGANKMELSLLKNSTFRPSLHEFVFF